MPAHMQRIRRRYVAELAQRFPPVAQPPPILTCFARDFARFRQQTEERHDGHAVSGTGQACRSHDRAAPARHVHLRLVPLMVYSYVPHCAASLSHVEPSPSDSCCVRRHPTHTLMRYAFHDT